MVKVEIITKTLPGFEDAWFVKKEKDYFVVSGADALFTGWEVLVFPAKETGEVIDLVEICGGRGITHEDAIEELEAM